MYRICLLFLILFCGCESEFDPEGKGNYTKEPKLFLNSLVFPETGLAVKVALTKPVFEQPNFELIEDIDFMLKVDGKEQSGFYFDTDDGYHKINNDEVKQGKAFELFCKHKDYSYLRAKDSLPLKPDVKNVEINLLKKEENSYVFTLSFEIKESSRKEEYYHLLYLSYKDSISKEFKEITGNSLVNHPLFEFNTLHGVVFSNRIFKEGWANISVIFYMSDAEVLSSDLDDLEFKFEVRGISKAYYNYFESLSSGRVNVISGFFTPSMSFTNVDGGLGIFAIYNPFIEIKKVKKI